MRTASRILNVSAGKIVLSFALFLSVTSMHSVLAAPDTAPDQFAKIHHSFKTAVHIDSSDREAIPLPPENIFHLVSYAAEPGQLQAYLTPGPHDGKKHPAIIWLTGGDSNAIGEMWSPHSRSNDQTAAAFRKAGLVLMLPSLRGGNHNPGKEEASAGEIDDILSAADYLSKQAYVDPARIYLGGHSTGGTLVLLTAEASNRFRAVFAYGPVRQIASYGTDMVPVDFSKLDPMEDLIRTPDHWLPSVSSPVFVLEGKNQPGNISELVAMKKHSVNPNITFLAVAGASHFSILAPTTELIAQKILQDDGAVSNIHISEAELAALFQ